MSEFPLAAAARAERAFAATPKIYRAFITVLFGPVVLIEAAYVTAETLFTAPLDACGDPPNWSDYAGSALVLGLCLWIAAAFAWPVINGLCVRRAAS